MDVVFEVLTNVTADLRKNSENHVRRPDHESGALGLPVGGNSEFRLIPSPSRDRAKIRRQPRLLHDCHTDDQSNRLPKLRHRAVGDVEIERRGHGANVVERVRLVLLDNP